jgi:hypothetical protein
MDQKGCKDCGRPLTEDDSGEYCPNCTARRAERFGKMGAIISGIGGAVVAIGGIVIVMINIFGDKNKK